jgi:hypothetical protein
MVELIGATTYGYNVFLNNYLRLWWRRREPNPHQGMFLIIISIG